MPDTQFHEAAKVPPRRSPTKAERLTPCECCAYPLSQRHHLLPVAEYDENDCTIQLCANCHELYHLIDGAYIKDQEGHLEFLGRFIQKSGKNFPQVHFDWLYEAVYRGKDLCRQYDSEAMRIARAQAAATEDQRCK